MKWIVLLLVLGAGGYLVYRWTRPKPPEQRACAKVAQLCGGRRQEVDKCVDGIKQLEKAVGHQAVERFAECTAQSTSCADAAGCAAGSALKAAPGELLRGLGRALDH